MALRRVDKTPAEKSVTKEQLKEYKILFDKIDTDGSGIVDVNELTAVTGYKPNMEFIKETTGNFKKGKNGSVGIDFDQFVRLVVARKAAAMRRSQVSDYAQSHAVATEPDKGFFNANGTWGSWVGDAIGIVIVVAILFWLRVWIWDSFLAVSLMAAEVAGRLLAGVLGAFVAFAILLAIFVGCLRGATSG